MKCPTCGGEYEQRQTDGDLFASVGLGRQQADLFSRAGSQTIAGNGEGRRDIPREAGGETSVHLDEGLRGQVRPENVRDLLRNAPLDGSKGNGANRRARLGSDWQPTDAQRLYCEQQGKDPAAFTLAFKEYYLAKGTAWSQWGLVWMKACREWQGHVAAKPPAPAETLREKELNLWKQRLLSKIWNPFWGPRVGEPGCMVPRELRP